MLSKGCSNLFYGSPCSKGWFCSDLAHHHHLQCPLPWLRFWSALILLFPSHRASFSALYLSSLWCRQLPCKSPIYENIGQLFSTTHEWRPENSTVWLSPLCWRMWTRTRISHEVWGIFSTLWAEDRRLCGIFYRAILMTSSHWTWVDWNWPFHPFSCRFLTPRKPHASSCRSMTNSRRQSARFVRSVESWCWRACGLHPCIPHHHILSCWAQRYLFLVWLSWRPCFTMRAYLAYQWPSKSHTFPPQKWTYLQTTQLDHPLTARKSASACQ